MDLAQKQITTAIRTVTELKEIIIAFPEGKSIEMEERIETLFLNEVEIDDLRRLVLVHYRSQIYRQNIVKI